MPVALMGGLVLVALLLGGCTISSESPDAVALGDRAGPSSGTTTAGTGTSRPSPEPPADEAGQPQPEEGAAGDGGDQSPEAGDAEQTPPPTTTAEGDEAGGGEPAEAATGAGSGQPETGTEPGAATEPPGSEDAAGTTTTGGAETAPVTEAAPDAAATDPGSLAGGAFDGRSRVSTVGIGAVYFGMSPEEAAERVGAVWEGEPTGGADCYVVTPANGPPGVALWVYHGTVERVDIDTPLLRTQSGLGVGTHLGELQSRLGDKLVVEDHPYLAGWTLATFVPTDPNDAAFRIAFDISGGEVIRFRAGRTEIVALGSCA